MIARLAAFAALGWLSCASSRAQSPQILTIDDAFTRVVATHPDLRVFDARQAALDAERERASQRPALVMGAQVENALGTGEARAFDGAELTLSLSSLLERGGKLDARRLLAQSRIDALASAREGKRLDLLAEIARRYLTAVAARARGEIARIDIAQRERAVDAARARLRAGASPESVVLAARAALARAELDRDRADQRFRAARQHLASLWAERDPTFEVTGDAMRLPEIEDFTALAAALDATPELEQLIGERRIGEARARLARSEREADVQWQIGVRRLFANDDLALIAGVSVPWDARGRAEPGVRVADAELAALEIERDAKGQSLYATLVEAHGRYQGARLEVARLRDDVLPLLARAEAAAERAYRAGAISALEWSQLQAEVVATRRQQLDVAIDGQSALIELQRLTGQSHLIAPRVAREGNAP